MTDRQARFKRPATTLRGDGGLRRVGFELEFSGLTIDQTVTVLQTTLGGTLHSKSVAERVLQVDSLGAFNIELDWNFLKTQAAKAEAAASNADDGHPWMDLLSQAASLLVPLEVVCPPIPITHLEVLDSMVSGLREAGAVGTEESLLAAYGVHINPEIADLDAATITPYLRAFGLLQWWLTDAHEVNISRRLSPYIELYPEAYVKLLSDGYESGMEQLFSDYLSHNATRNRALDLLPLLAEIDPQRVRRAVDDPKVKARPTFHYRLPNCHIEKPDWSLASAWNRWWIVEQLAARPQQLAQLSAAFRQHWRPLLGLDRAGWMEFTDRWLQDREWA